MKIQIQFDLKINRLVRYFVLSDLTLWAGWGLLAPVFSVFIIQKIEGATLTSVGIAAAIYFIVKSLVQLPVANYLDKTEGEKDDFYVLLGSLFMMGIAAFSFILVDKLWQLYLVQLFHAVAAGFYVPSWAGIFSRHLDKDRLAFDWSLDSTAISLAAGVTGFLGGVLGNYFGFNILFFLAGVLSLVSALIIFWAPDLIFPPKNKTPFIKDHLPFKTP